MGERQVSRPTPPFIARIIHGSSSTEAPLVSVYKSWEEVAATVNDIQGSPYGPPVELPRELHDLKPEQLSALWNFINELIDDIT